MLREASDEPSVVRKDVFIASTLVFNTFLWQYIVYVVIKSLLSIPSITYIQNVVWAAHYISIVGSTIGGSILSKIVSRVKFLFLWIILGVISSALLTLLSSSIVTHALMMSIFLGISIGLGMPSCLAYFADCTEIENRGRISGITFLVTNLSAPLFVISFSMFDLNVNSLILTVWRASVLVVFLLKPKERVVSREKGKNLFISIVRDKSFGLYFTAWLMFNLIDNFEMPILDYIFGDFHYALIAPIIGSFFTLIAGLLCDRIGRKRVVLYGFVTMGIAYAIIGIAPTALFSWYFFLTTESISWGIFFVTFILVLWGDLSESGSREKYYVIGAVTPFFLSDIVRVLSTPYVVLIPRESAFSVASFFLFIAVLPLLYAPETLPEKQMELRRLRKYMEKAKKVREKYQETSDET